MSDLDRDETMKALEETGSRIGRIAAEMLNQDRQRIAELEAKLIKSRAIVASLQQAGAKWNQAGRPRGSER